MTEARDLRRGTATDRGAQQPTRTVYSVGELTRDIKMNLEGNFCNLWVAGEISNLKRPPSGHLYFTLKDAKAALPGVMFRGSMRHLRFQPKDGMAVLLWGHITVYEPRGAYQIRVERMEPRGKGALQIAFEELKGRLAEEGLFDPARKRPLPLLPQRLGIVTSPTGAAIRDICRILHRRFPNLEVLVYPAQVQGDLAAADIAKGVQVLNRLGGFDAIIVTRGGGSLEDLWPFNEESVARAIAASATPVVSAVGHEVDFTIADFVADVRAPTPSAAAEIVVRSKEDFVARVAELSQRLDRGVGRHLTDLRASAERIATHRAFSAALHAFEMKSQKLDEIRYRARGVLERRLRSLSRGLHGLQNRLDAQRMDRRMGEARGSLQKLVARMSAAADRRVSAKRGPFTGLVAALEAMSPLAVLGRGYSLTWSERGKLLRDTSGVRRGDRLRVDLHRGRLRCRVEEVETGTGRELADDGLGPGQGQGQRQRPAPERETSTEPDSNGER